MLPAQINEPGAQISPCESPNGDTLYFCNWSRAAGSSFDVYYSVMTDSGWGPKQELGVPINTPSHELGMRLSRDGTMMVVSQSGDLFYHERQQDGTWGTAIDFGDSVNDWRNDLHVCLGPDNNELFFYKEGPNHGDVWSSRKIDGVWRQAAPLSAPICSTFTREDSPCLLADGYTLVFRHGPSQGGRELYFSMDTTRMTNITNPRPLPAQQEGGLRLNWIPEGELELFIGERPGLYSVRVFNVLGQTLLREDITFSGVQTSTRGSVRLLPSASGSYFVSVVVRDQMLTSKITISR